MKPFVLVASTLLFAAAPAAPVAGPAPFTVQHKGRAYTLDTASVVGGAILRPNDHVDVVAVLHDGPKAVSLMLLQNVIVLGQAAPAPGEPRQLSLLVLPEEAQLLALAKATGQLTMTLRNETDVDVMESKELATEASAISGELVKVTPGAKK